MSRKAPSQMGLFLCAKLDFYSECVLLAAIDGIKAERQNRENVI